MEKIVVSDKFKHNGNGFKYFIGYTDGSITDLYALFQIKVVDKKYTKYFDDCGKDTSFKIEVNDMFLKYNKIWNRLKRH